jgi:hypothetical protein
VAGKPARLSIEIISDAVSGVKGLDDTSAAAGNLESKMDSAASAARNMDKALSNATGSAARDLDNVAESTDRMATKTGTATGAMGALAGGFEALGLGAVATGLQVVGASTDFVSGGMDLLTLALESTKVKQIATTVTTYAQAVATNVASAATKAWAGVQWLLNVAMEANPIGLVVIGVMLLVGAIILAYNKSDTFRKIVTGAFEAVTAAASWLWKNVLVPFGKFVADVFVAYWDALSKGLSTVVGWFKDALEWAAKLWEKLQDFIGGTVGKVLDMFKGSTTLTVLTGSSVATATTGADVNALAGRALSTVDGRIGLRVSPPIVNVYLDGRRVRGLVSKVVSDAMHADGRHLAAGGWA